MIRLREASQDLTDLLLELNLIDLNTYDKNEVEQILIKFMKGCGLRPHVMPFPPSLSPLRVAELNKNTEKWQAFPHAL